MRELVEYIVKNIVSNPDAVKVEEQTSGSEVEILLTVDPSDMGVVIGKGGQTIKALRRLLTVRAIAEGVKVYVKLYEPPGEEGSDEPSLQAS